MIRVRTTTILAVIVVAALALPAPVAADDQEDESLVDQVSEGAESLAETASEIADGLAGAAEGYANRAAAYDPFAEPNWSAETSASALESDIDGNATAYESWLSTRLTATEERDVLAVSVENTTDEATVYLTAEVENESYRHLTAARSTSRDVDERCTLEGRAGENAPEELETFREDFVATNESLSSEYIGRFGTEYGGKIDCSFLKP